MSGIKRKRAHQNKESWFCQHGIQGFTACSHAFKTASGIQCTNYAEEFSESQYIGEKHEIAVKGNNPFVFTKWDHHNSCLLYTSDAADDLLCVDLGGRRIIK